VWIDARIKLILFTHTANNKRNIFRWQVAELPDIVVVAAGNRIQRPPALIVTHAGIRLVVVVADLPQRFGDRFPCVTVENKESKFDLAFLAVELAIGNIRNRGHILDLLDRGFLVGPTDFVHAGAARERHAIPPERVAGWALENEIVFGLEHMNIFATSERFAQGVTTKDGDTIDHNSDS
jgi:hypothetical protein